jgi:hypothetical protein
MLTKGGHTRIPFLEELARDSTRPVVVAALLHNSTNPDSVFKDLDAIAEAQANGYYLVGAVSCCPLSMDFTLHSPYVFEGWKPGSRRCRSRESVQAKLREPAFRAALREEIAAPGALSAVQRRMGQGARHRGARQGAGAALDRRAG